MGGPHDAVGDGEGEGAVAEGLGDAERHDQEPGHGREHDEPDRALLGVDDARQPRVADPRPPQHGRARASPGRAPSHVGSATISAVHWVKPSTKTRSKNSSSGLTDSWTRGSASIRGRCFGVLRRRGDIAPC